MSEAYITRDGKSTIWKKMQIYIYIYIYQMLSDVIQTGKYGTAAKENVLQILLHIQMILYTSNA